MAWNESANVCGGKSEATEAEAAPQSGSRAANIINGCLQTNR